MIRTTNQYSMISKKAQLVALALLILVASVKTIKAYAHVDLIEVSPPGTEEVRDFEEKTRDAVENGNLC